MTGILVSDTMPAGIHFVGPVRIDPPVSGTAVQPNEPPILASGLTLTSGERLTLTFPVMVSNGLAAGTRLTNTVAVTSVQFSIPVIATATITVDSVVIYLPILIKNS
jgi:hypothetical protein